MMASHRRKWGWWLAAVLAVAVAAGLFLYRHTGVLPGGPDGPAPADLAALDAVVIDTVYVTVSDGETVPIVRERRADIVEREKEAPVPPETEVPASVEMATPAASEAETPAPVETVLSIPVTEVNGLVRKKMGQSVTLATKAPDRISVTLSGSVNVPVLGDQTMDLVTAHFKIVEAKGDHMILQLDSGSALNLASDLLAPLLLDRLPAGLVESFSSGRAVINLSAVPKLGTFLSEVSLTGVSVDESNIKLKTVPK